MQEVVNLHDSASVPSLGKTNLVPSLLIWSELALLNANSLYRLCILSSDKSTYCLFFFWIWTRYFNDIMLIKLFTVIYIWAGKIIPRPRTYCNKNVPIYAAASRVNGRNNWDLMPWNTVKHVLPDWLSCFSQSQQSRQFRSRVSWWSGPAARYPCLLSAKC